MTKEYIDKILGKIFICPSKSTYATLVLIIEKLEWDLLVYIIYYTLNALTIKNQNTPLLIWETFAHLCSAKIYNKFDIVVPFKKIYIKERIKEKRVFYTWYGLYKYIVMPFGLFNTPKTFYFYINEKWKEILDHFCTTYLNKKLIYSESIFIHIDHVQKVLSKLRDAKLFLNIWKCDFLVKEVKYLGVIISITSLKID